MKKLNLLLVIVSLLLIVTPILATASLYEYYDTNDDARITNVNDPNKWMAQTFNASSTHPVRYIALKISRFGNPNTVTVSLRATTGVNPSGVDIAVGTINGNLLSTTNSVLTPWQGINLTSATNLTVGTKYAIVVRSSNADATNYLSWREDQTAPTYLNGTQLTSANAGGTWTNAPTEVLMFRIYDVAPTTPTSPNFTITAENKYNNTQLSNFKVWLNGTLDTNTGLTHTYGWKMNATSPKYDVIVGKLNYFNETYTNYKTNVTLKGNLTAYTRIMAYDGLTGTFISTFYINSSFGIKNTTTGSIYLPLHLNNYNITIYNITGYQSKSVNLIVPTYLKSYNFSLYTANSFNIYFFDEQTDKHIKENTSINLNILGETLINRTNVTLSNYTYYIDLLTPDLYRLNYLVNGYYLNNYYQILTNSSFANLTLYSMASNVTNCLFTLNVKNSISNLNYPDVIVKLQRFYTSQGLWKTVQSDRSGEFGNTFFHIIESNTDYRFVLLDLAGNTLKTTSANKFVCSGGLLTYTQLVTPYSSISTPVRPDITFITNLPNATENGSIIWTVTNGDTHALNISVVKTTIYTDQVICSSSQTGTGGIVPCNATGYSGEVKIKVYVDGDYYASWYVILTKPFLEQTLGKKDAVIFAILIFITIVFIGAFSPITTLATIPLSLLIIYWFGLLSAVTIGVILLSGIIAIIIGIKIKRY